MGKEGRLYRRLKLTVGGEKIETQNEENIWGMIKKTGM